MTPRIANEIELKAVCDAMTTHYGVRFYHSMNKWMEAGNTEYFLICEDIIIRDGFISDSPGFSGSIAWVQFGGGPANCCILSRPSDPPNGRDAWTWSVVTLDVATEAA